MKKLKELLKKMVGQTPTEDRYGRRYQRGYLRMQRDRVIRERLGIARRYGIELPEAGMLAKCTPVKGQLRQPGKLRRVEFGVHETGLISFN